MLKEQYGPFPASGSANMDSAPMHHPTDFNATLQCHRGRSKGSKTAWVKIQKSGNANFKIAYTLTLALTAA